VVTPSLSMSPGWGHQRDAIHHLKDLQEAATHLNRPLSSQRGWCQWGMGGWASPLVHPTSSLRRRGGLTGCHRLSLSSAKRKKEDVQRSAVDVPVPSMCCTEKRKCFLKKTKQKGKIRLLKSDLCRNYLVIKISSLWFYSLGE